MSSRPPGPPPLLRQDTEEKMKTAGAGAGSDDEDSDGFEQPSITRHITIPHAAPGHEAEAVAAAAEAAAAAAAEEPSNLPLEAEQLISMSRVSPPVVSPDGLRAVLAVKEIGGAAPGGPDLLFSAEDDATDEQVTWTTRLYVVNLGADGAEGPASGGPQWLPGRGARPLTNAAGRSDSSPVWLDSTTVAFLSNRSGSSQVWCISLQGGEARQLTNYPLPVGDLSFNAHRSLLAFSCRVRSGLGMAETAAADEKAKKRRTNFMHYKRLMVRHWDTWCDEKRSHIFVQALTRSDAGLWSLDTDFSPVDVMAGLEQDCPLPPFGGAEHYSVSPRGDEVAFTAHAHANEARRAWTTNTHVYTVALGWRVARSTAEGGSDDRVDVEAPVCVSAANEGYDTEPVHSPDGRWLAYLSMPRGGYEADRARVMVVDRVSGGAPRELLPEGVFPHSAASLAWAADSSSLYVQSAVEARVVYFVATLGAPDGTAPRLVLSGQRSAGLAVRPCGSGLVFSRDSMQSPAEVWASGPFGEEPRRLTGFNAARLGRLLLSEPEEVWFEGAGGERVQAWFLPPTGREEGKKYPMACVIHGGPQGFIGDDWHYRWNMQFYATHGYAVLAVNFHGSSSFGQEFTDSIRGDWDGKPIQDVLLGVEHALKQYPWVDPERLGALGASYGGFAINCVNAASDRFKCLVNHDGVFNQSLMYFATEEVFFPEWEMKGAPWESAKYDECSPYRKVDQWNTPCLVIHGGKDYRVPDVEGLGTYTALQRRGIESEFLYFPDENHWVLNPANSVVWHRHVLAWLDRFLKK